MRVSWILTVWDMALRSWGIGILPGKGPVVGGHAADALLLGAGEVFDDGSVVDAMSWGRIKASLGH